MLSRFFRLHLETLKRAPLVSQHAEFVVADGLSGGKRVKTCVPLSFHVKIPTAAGRRCRCSKVQPQLDTLVIFILLRELGGQRAAVTSCFNDAQCGSEAKLETPPISGPGDG